MDIQLTQVSRIGEVAPRAATQAAMDYERVERALRFLKANYQRRPALEEVAAHIHLSPFHFERLFQRWAGTSPKRFVQFLTKEHAKGLLRQSASLLDATYGAGLSSPGRLHDLFITCEAMTPGDYKQRGHGLTIQYDVHPTPFGDCVLGMTDKGVCALHFLAGKSRRDVLADIREEWGAAKFVEDQEATGKMCRKIFDNEKSRRNPLPLFIRGTNFQLKVWQALLAIPPGKLVCYQDIASALGMPKASRAVGSAIGKNSIGYLIPCHRVIQSLGSVGDYRWGSARKQVIIGWEAARGT